jgi:hypothetical protein
MKKMRQAGRSIPVDLATAEEFNIGFHEGYRDPFTRDQSRMAEYANGSRVQKSKVDNVKDVHAVGALGTVLGSIGVPGIGVAYFIAWDDMPQRVTMVYETKVRRA